VNVSRDRFCEAVEKLEPDVLGLSALLTTTMMEMREIIRALDARGLRQRCKVLVGGAPVSEQFARQIGADGFARTRSRPWRRPSGLPRLNRPDQSAMRR